MSRFSFKELKTRRAVARAVIEPLLVGKRDGTVRSAYERIAPGPDQKIHTALAPLTASFRFSSSESSLYPHSTNLQNLANKVARLDEKYRVRDCIVARPGMVLLAADWRGAEAILVGAYSEDWDYVDQLIGGVDTHTEHAKHFFGQAAFDRAEGAHRALMRDTAKTVTYASFYFAQPPTVQAKINKEAEFTGVWLSLDEVVAYRSKLLQLHPLEAWWARVRAELAKSGNESRNCFGYRRVFWHPDPDKRLKEALSTYPQSTVAWRSNTSIVEIYKHVHQPGQRELLLQIHDEHFFQCLPAEVEATIEACTPILEAPFTIHGREVYLPVEWKSGPSWGQMTSVSSRTHANAR